MGLPKTTDWLEHFKLHGEGEGEGDVEGDGEGRQGKTYFPGKTAFPSSVNL